MRSKAQDPLYPLFHHLPYTTVSDITCYQRGQSFIFFFTCKLDNVSSYQFLAWVNIVPLIVSPVQILPRFRVQTQDNLHKHLSLDVGNVSTSDKFYIYVIDYKRFTMILLRIFKRKKWESLEFASSMAVTEEPILSRLDRLDNMVSFPSFLGFLY